MVKNLLFFLKILLNEINLILFLDDIKNLKRVLEVNGFFIFIFENCINDNSYTFAVNFFVGG